MKTERAQREDLPEILELQKLCYRSEAELIGDWTIEPLTQTQAQIEKEFESKTFLVLRREGKIIASARANELDGTCRIGKVIVHPDFQGLGLGNGILGAIESAFPDASRYELYTGSLSERNLAFYRSRGYTDYAEKRVSDALTLIFLEKKNPSGRFGRPVANPASLPWDFSGLKDMGEYRELWQYLPRLELRMVEQHEECKHSPGDTFLLENAYDRPKGVCSALLHVMDLYVWRASLGFPSWNPGDRQTYRLHCPDAKGTVWELRRVDRTAPVRKVGDDENLERFAGLIRASFFTVARDLGLTRKNCPGHPSFLEVDKLEALRKSGTELYCMEEDGSATGFIALEKSATEPDAFYIEKLAVHPSLRHGKRGLRLMEIAEARIRELGGRFSSVALVDEQAVLKSWYASLGYRETGKKTFPHLPFTVCFMRKDL